MDTFVTMRSVLSVGILCMAYISVSCAPTTDLNKSIQPVDVEQELVRHHHSTRTHDESDADDNSYSVEKGNIGDESSPVESIEDIPVNSEQENDREQSYEEEDLYDMTVGDVIRDVLSTLRDHPEIVKVLMENEKEKIATRLAEDAIDSVGADLSEFQEPAEQLKTDPKRVEKTDGKSGHAQTSATKRHMNGYQGNMVGANDAEFNEFMNHKRTNEVLDDTFTNTKRDSSESVQQYDGFNGFKKIPKEVANKYKILYGSDSLDESGSYDYRRHLEDNSKSDDSSSMEDIQPRYRFPFITPSQYYKNYRGSQSSDESSKSQDNEVSSSHEETVPQTGSAVPDSETDTKQEDSSSESSEEQLSWLLRQMEANKRADESQKNM